MTDIDVKTNAEAPRRAKGDEGEAEQHSIPDQIKADQYAKARTAMGREHRGLRFNKIKPPGAA